MMTNKGAALRYKHICSRDCSLLQVSLTSPIHFDKGWRLFPHLNCVNVKMFLCSSAYFFLSPHELRALQLACTSAFKPKQICFCLGAQRANLDIFNLPPTKALKCNACAQKMICAFYVTEDLKFPTFMKISFSLPHSP